MHACFYVCFACRASFEDRIRKKREKRTSRDGRRRFRQAVDQFATSSREPVSRGTKEGKEDLVTIGIFRLSSRDAYPDKDRESWQLLEFPRKGSDDRDGETYIS